MKTHPYTKFRTGQKVWVDDYKPMYIMGVSYLDSVPLGYIVVHQLKYMENTFTISEERIQTRNKDEKIKLRLKE